MGVGIQDGGVFGASSGATCAHSHTDASTETLVLVARALEAALARDLLDQRAKLGLVGLDQPGSDCQGRPLGCVASWLVRASPSSAAERLRRSYGTSGATAIPRSAASRASAN